LSFAPSNTNHFISNETLQKKNAELINKGQTTMTVFSFGTAKTEEINKTPLMKRKKFNIKAKAPIILDRT